MWKEMSNPERGGTYQYQSHPAVLSGEQDANGIQPRLNSVSVLLAAQNGRV